MEKDTAILVRLETRRLEFWRAAAKGAGLNLSELVRQSTSRAARELLAKSIWGTPPTEQGPGGNAV